MIYFCSIKDINSYADVYILGLPGVLYILKFLLFECLWEYLLGQFTVPYLSCPDTLS